MDREKVIKGLECYLSMRRGEKIVCKAEYCPYWGEDDDTGFIICDNYQIEADALELLKEDENRIANYRRWHENQKNTIKELLKAQKPRLVTESDFDGADIYGYIPVWTEEKDGDMYWECIPKAAITDPDGIGVLRYWTSRPTDEQSEAIPWMT